MLQDPMSKTGWKPILDQNGNSLRAKHSNPAAFFSALSEIFETRLESKHHLNLTHHYQKYSMTSTIHWVLCLAMLLLGLASNYLGSNKVVNLWLNPFMAFLAWNFLVYLAIVSRRLLNWRSTHANHALLASVSRLAEWLQASWKRHMSHLHPDTKFHVLLGKTQFAFRRAWFQHFPGLVLNRTARQLHILAIFLTAGVTAGLYLRGFAESYQFAWDSTLVDPEARAFWLDLLFGPILLIMRPIYPQGLPPFQPGNGAAWIHLFALASLIYIAIPRTLLALWAQRQIKRQLHNLSLPFQNPEWQNLYSEYDPDPLPLHLIFYSYQLDAPQLDQLQIRLKEHLPGKFRKGSEISVNWGHDIDSDCIHGEQGLWVLVFNGAQTPEEEIHGEFAAHFRESIVNGHRRRGMLVVVDTQSLSDERKEERLAAWNKVFTAHQLHQWSKISLSQNRPQTPNSELQDAVIWFGS